MTEKAPKILVVTGPTATGKTAAGVLLAEQYGGEVVSADSMQVYRGMNIGTAKATEAEMRDIPHHMLDVASPAENYSVARYVREADVCVRDILSRGKLPVVVGGTGLYIDSLVLGRDFGGDETDAALRCKLSEKYDRLGGQSLLEELARVDPERARRLHPADKKRIVRALEVWYATGQTITRHDEETRKRPPRYDAAQIALGFADRAALYARIDRRVDRMVADGLFEEVRALLNAGVPAACTAMQAIGYKESAAALRGDMAVEEAVETIKRESRRYAKRQLTWLRAKKNLHWFLWGDSQNWLDFRQNSTQFLSTYGLK